MATKIGKYNFEGPFRNAGDLHNRSGVYAVLTRRTSPGDYDVIDIGETVKVRDRIVNHDRRDQWERNNRGTLAFAAYYCEATRIQVEQELRALLNPVCGDR